MKTLTVFTPNYNRAYCLPRLYESLLRQSSRDFVWMVIDDGSTDNTAEVVDSWKKEGKIEIVYIYQQNRGMVGGYDTAYHHIETELSVCIDSDDYMTDNAVEVILQTWSRHDDQRHMGVVGPDVTTGGQVIGDPFPDSLTECTHTEVRQKYKIRGDKKYVLRTDLVKPLLPYPYVEGEKFPSAMYLYLPLEKKYKYLVTNTPLCVVEYMADGNSNNKIRQYRNNPHAFALYRMGKMKHACNYIDRFRHAVHYVSSCIIARDIPLLRNNDYKLTTTLALPIGALLALYVKRTSRTSVNRTLNK